MFSEAKETCEAPDFLFAMATTRYTADYMFLSYSLPRLRWKLETVLTARGDDPTNAANGTQSHDCATSLTTPVQVDGQCAGAATVLQLLQKMHDPFIKYK